ncbi:MAG: hypothetical protein ACYS1A_18455 [Planctomycetota bacterium]|jgi:hypothetical protein
MKKGDVFELSNGTALECIGHSSRDGSAFVEPVANALEATNRLKGFNHSEKPLDLPQMDFSGAGTVAESQDSEQSNVPLEMPSVF